MLKALYRVNYKNGDRETYDHIGTKNKYHHWFQHTKELFEVMQSFYPWVGSSEITSFFLSYNHFTEFTVCQAFTKKTPIFHKVVKKSKFPCIFIITGKEHPFALKLLGLSKDMEFFIWDESQLFW